MDDKLKRLTDLKGQRKKCDEEIKALTDAINNELKLAISSGRKPRKPKQAKLPL